MLHYHRKPQEYCECVGNLMHVSQCCTVHEASKSCVDGCVSMLVSGVLYVLATLVRVGQCCASRRQCSDLTSLFSHLNLLLVFSAFSSVEHVQDVGNVLEMFLNSLTDPAKLLKSILFRSSILFTLKAAELWWVHDFISMYWTVSKACSAQLSVLILFPLVWPKILTLATMYPLVFWGDSLASWLTQEEHHWFWYVRPSAFKFLCSCVSCMVELYLTTEKVVKNL